VIGALAGDIRVVPPTHERTGVGVAFLQRNQVSHGLYRGQLVPAAEGHEDRTPADGGVKALRESPAGTDVQVPDERPHTLGKPGGDRFLIVLRCGGSDLDMLFRAVGIQEIPRHIDDGLPAPAHDEPWGLRHDRHRSSFQVLPPGELDETRGIFLRYDDRHALLGLADGQFRTVQAFVFLGHGIQVDLQAVCQFADGDAHAARAEVVAALDEAGGLRVSEKPLELSLFRGIALLYLSSAGFQGLQRVRLGGARGASDAVPSGAPAQ